MKMLKKAGAIAIAGAMALTLGTVSALAADEVSLKINGEITKAEDASGVITVTVPYEAVGVDQVTLLAEIGTAANTFTGSIEYKTTAYIDQESKDDSFVFNINKSRLIPESEYIDDNAEAVYINVKIGGTGINEIEADQIGNVKVYEKPAAPTEKTPAEKIAEQVTDNLLKVDGAQVTSYFGKENTGIMRMNINNYLTAENDETPAIDLATQVVKIDGVEARYTVYNGVTKLVALVDTAKTSHEVEIVTKDGGSLQLKYGDSDLDEASKLDAGDMSTLINMILSTTAPESNAQYNHVAADADGDVKLDAGDMSTLINLILDSTLIPGAANK